MVKTLRIRNRLARPFLPSICFARPVVLGDETTSNATFLTYLIAVVVHGFKIEAIDLLSTHGHQSSQRSLLLES